MKKRIMSNERLKVGEVFIINRDLCKDEDVLNWYDEFKNNGLLIADVIESESNGVWVEGCPYRIDLDEIQVMTYSLAFVNYIDKTISLTGISKGVYDAGINVKEFFKLNNEDFEKTLKFIDNFRISEIATYDEFEDDKDYHNLFVSTLKNLEKFIQSKNENKSDIDFFFCWEKDITNL